MKQKQAPVRAESRLFRAQARLGEVLAIEPRALEFSYLYSGVPRNEHLDDGITVVQIRGPLEHHKTYWWDSYEAILDRVEGAMTGQDRCIHHEWEHGHEDNYKAIAAAPARAVILCIDSPGGEAAGSTFAHRRIRRLRAKYNIPLFAFANETACSAAYAIASACDEVWLPDTGTVGSIGVIATMFDRTAMNKKDGLRIELVTSGERKADGHADRVLTDEIRERMQERVNKLAAVFFETVAKARGTNAKSITRLEAGVFTGEDAVQVGIADGVANYDRFLRIVRAALRTRDVLADSSAA